MVHLALQSVESFTTLYLKPNDFVLRIIGVAKTSKPEYMGPSDTKHTSFIYSVEKETLYAQFVQLQMEFQLDVTETVTIMARTAAGAFTDTLDKRPEMDQNKFRKQKMDF